MARWIPILATCGLFLSKSAHADSTTAVPPPDPTVITADEQRLRWILDTASSDAERGRERAAVLDATLSAILLPPGVILASRKDPGLEAVGINLIVDGGWSLLRLFSTPFPSSMETLRSQHDQLQASGAAPEVVVKETEDEFRRLAARRRGTAPWLVALELIAGSLEAGGGMYLLLTNSPVTRTATTVGALGVGLGVPELLVGLYGLLPQPASSEEQWWNIYEMSKPTPVPSAPSGPSLSVAPVPHGAAGAVGFSF
jgi:hypothetical protein